MSEKLQNLKNTHETLKKEVDKKQCIEKMESENKRRLKSQLELKCKELSDSQAKEKVRNICTKMFVSPWKIARILTTVSHFVCQELQEKITMLSKEMMEVTMVKNELEEEIEQKESLIENILKNELVKNQVFLSTSFQTHSILTV